MSLVESVQEVFAPGGMLARADARFVPREGQTQMAMAVAQTIEAGGALVVEAGTGVGKTFAYLVPALLSGERVLLSTATKALQDQLFSRDLPLLAEVLGLPVRMALLKGRASYLCLHRMELARQDISAREPGVARVLSKVEEWSRRTQAGDLAELTGLDERSPVLPLVTSTRENCLGSACPKFRECHVHQARREALAADIVVINHHLFFADVAVRESGMAELLPTVRVVVFDEAHQISETGVQFLGLSLSTGQLMDFGKDMLAAGLQRARGMADWVGLANNVDLAARDLRLVVGELRAGTKLRWTDEAPEGTQPEAWRAAIRRLALACAQGQAALDAVSETAPELERLYERGSELLARLAHFDGAGSPDAVRWLDVGSQLRLVESPLDIAEAMRTRLMAAPPQAVGEDGWPQAPAAGPGRSWIFTSATLGDDEKLSWFTERAGLQDAKILRVASPFDYASQAALYVPRHLPPPVDPSHSGALAQWISQAAAQLGGRTLVLTTTLKALRGIGDALHAQFAASGELEVLVQGEWPKRRLMQRFREGSAHGQPGCILVASATFWEGFDVPGDALQLVIIDKLPFPPPGDPLVEAYTQRIEKSGGKAFTSYALPEAAVALKQGAGRLIRRESDQGILVVGDTRLVTMGYGKRLLAALPPMRRLESPQEFDRALQALTRTSTTDLPCP
ncbi:ATP-dependent DNA helicase [Acidovorax sp.]|jgi:ATP-dependent DNA helicase DinG|uniref:ATP-dependent DNA helicase n=1 Tax=Acidovorax sp. TaxID=1872122 RepID=UPI0025BC640A|nr:ATP-dependent DNA helicase [Acidovorax sp.]MCI5069771.1 ATP-dependent DNA helicase [Acidovorax sp.]